MAIFSKKNDDSSPLSFARDPDRAKRFFYHAKAAGDSRNFDYAIECYINGLRYEPDSLENHKLLRDVAIMRKGEGGKTAGITEKYKPSGKSTIDRLMHTEKIWCKDPQNVTLMAEVMDRAVETDRLHIDLDLIEVARWVGGLILETKGNIPGSAKSAYLKATDLFSQLDAFPEAVEACKLALRVDPNNELLTKRLKDLEAEQTMQKGGYTSENVREGSFHSAVRDIDKQRQLERDDAITVRGSMLEEEIQQRRTEYEKNPQDVDQLGKLVAVLARRETDADDEEAIRLLEKGMKLTGQYRYKMRLGDIRIRQFNRRLRQLNHAAKKQPKNQEVKNQIQSLMQHKLQFELDEYQERIQNYPTDLSLRFELGRRLFATHKHDEAIAAFQQAKSDPKYRVVSLDFLGRCYAAKNWLEESVDTLQQGVEAHKNTDDRLALELRYHLMLSLRQLAMKEKSAERAKESQKIASQILQTDITFRDIRQQMDSIRQLVDELGKHS